jgi:CubicO group peptidase (beta-lactamase class C family)
LPQNLFDPLNMVDTAFYVPRDKLSRYATSYTTTSSGRLQFVFRPRMDYVSFWAPNFISLGAGIVSTARDYAR